MITECEPFLSSYYTIGKIMHKYVVSSIQTARIKHAEIHFYHFVSACISAGYSSASLSF